MSMSWMLREQTAFWDCTTTNATDPLFTESIPIYNPTNQLFCSSFLELQLGIQPPLKREITSNDLSIQILPASNCRVWPLWQVVWLFSFKKAFFVLLFVETPYIQRRSTTFANWSLLSIRSSSTLKFCYFVNSFVLFYCWLLTFDVFIWACSNGISFRSSEVLADRS